MKVLFLAFVFYHGLVGDFANVSPYVGKWYNVSKTSPIKEVSFLSDQNVKFSNNIYTVLQTYTLRPTAVDHNRFVGVFRLLNKGKIVKQSRVDLKLLANDLMELNIDDKRLVLRKY